MRAMRWIEKNIPSDAVFLVESRRFKETSIFGGDAGWYLPYFTKRANTLPPQYALVFETPIEAGYSQDMIDLVFELENTPLSEPNAIEILCRRKITHIYVGQHLLGGTPEIIGSYYSVEEVKSNPAMELIYHL
jgi:hypothetical protein